jgi:hypothetical protein
MAASQGKEMSTRPTDADKRVINHFVLDPVFRPQALSFLFLDPGL